MTTRKSYNNRRGFTLIEILIVVGIIAVLAGLLIPISSLIRKRASETRTRALIQKLSAGCHAYFADFNAYPGIIDDAQLYPLNLLPPSYTAPGGKSFALSGVPYVTSSQNLVLSLVGGTSIAVDSTGTVTGFTFDPLQLKMGALQSLNPANQRSYNSYIDFTAAELSGASPPEFVDSFGVSSPIIYIRARPGATYVCDGDPAAPKDSFNFQYRSDYLRPYWQNAGQAGQLFPTFQAANSTVVLYNTPYDFFKNPNLPYSSPSTPNVVGVPRGKNTFIMISAGADGIFGTKDDVISAE